jgi:predicted O-linked N-acetylglucosamine transferase (SPINDLY family)
MDTPKQATVSMNPRRLLELYLEGRHGEIAAEFVRVLAFLDGFSYTEFSAESQVALDLVVEHLLYFFTKPDFILDDLATENLIRLSPVISNVVAISSFRNTDAQLEVIRRQPNNLLRILPLLSVRNRARFDYAEMFRLQPAWTSLWYTMYFQSAEAPVTELILDNLTRHVRHLDPNLSYIGPEITYAFSFSTYIDIEADRPLKEGLNKLIRAVLSGVKVTNRSAERTKIIGPTRRRRIAVITGRWVPTSSVYKAMYSLVAALRENYDLTLVELIEHKPNTDRKLFDDVRLVRIADRKLECGAILDNDFDLAFYPDLGMSMEERHLANLRIAPIQVMGLGHSVSTWGADIDYFISGRDVELAKNAADNYSERLVLIPGTGLDPTWPPYERHGKRAEDGSFIVNCSWSAAQCRSPHLAVLQRILRESKRKIRFRIFAGMGLHRHNAFLPFVQEIGSVLGADNVEVIGDMVFPEYMAKLEEGEFTIDAHPIGGYNTVIDTLHVGLPFVSLEGQKFYNRVASAVLRLAGLKELITDNAEDYAALTLRLIHDDRYRTGLQKKIAKLDLIALLAQPETPKHFAKAIDTLIANHERYKAEWEQGKRGAIVIK